MVIHCQVITSQVMAYRPDRDRPVIGRPVPHAAVGHHQWQRKVILTTLSVKDRYFGRVTAWVSGEPARAGHEPAVRWREAPRRGGCRALPAAGCLERECRKMIILAGQPATVAAVRKIGISGPPHGTLIGLAYVLRAGRRPGPDAIAGHSIPSVNRWLARLCECLPDCRPKLASQPARPGSGAALGGPAGLLPPFPGSRISPARPGPRWGGGGRWRLFSCPARPPAAGSTTNGYLSRPQRCSASIRLIT